MKTFGKCMLAVAALGILGAGHANAFEQNGYRIPAGKLTGAVQAASEDDNPPEWKGGKRVIASLFERGGIRVDPRVLISNAEKDDEETTDDRSAGRSEDQEDDEKASAADLASTQ